MFDIKVPASAQRILDLLEAAGFEAFVVGGCVRDALLGREPNDWDVTTSALPEQVKRVMADAGVRTADTGLQHGTVTVIIDGEGFETTTYRSDGAYTDGRHPDSVEFLKTIDGDLARRDFTVNAMAYSPARGLVDLHGGRDDLAAGVLRAVGEPHVRFEEDGLRIMRALRFAAAFGFSVDPATASALHEDRELLSNVSVERVWTELSKLLLGPGAVPILREFADVVAVIIPELEPEFGFDQHNPHHVHDVWEHSLHALQAAVDADADLPMRVAVLLHDSGKPGCFTRGEDGIGHMYGHDEAGARLAQAALERLRAPNAIRDEAVYLVRNHMFSPPRTAKGARRFLAKHGEHMAARLFEIERYDNAGTGVPQPVDGEYPSAYARAEALAREELEREPVFGVRDLAVDGRDLMAAGIPQGPQIGAVLRRLLDAVVDGEVPNEREALLELALA